MIRIFLTLLFISSTSFAASTSSDDSETSISASEQVTKLYDKDYELELHILFVSKDQRRKQIATKLLNYVETNIINFSQIFIEVAEDNLDAISFYKKNNFVFLNFRHNYYMYNNKNIDAKCFIKKINHE